jgi:hypothetical protein
MEKSFHIHDSSWDWRTILCSLSFKMDKQLCLCSVQETWGLKNKQGAFLHH